MRRLKILLLSSHVLLFTLLLLGDVHAQEERLPDYIAQPVGPPPSTESLVGELAPMTVYRIDANPSQGFHWPYFLAVADSVAPGAPLLVQPNNGRAGAPYESHLYWASIYNEQLIYDFGKRLGVIGLTPAFPRPAVDGPDGNLYVFALTRAAMTADDPALMRPDLQLLAMIDDARRRLSGAGHEVPSDALLWGFSAAADFVTRMSVLHPERVRAVAAGGLGGLPILPVSSDNGQPLSYPVGVGDMETIVGRPFQDDALRRTPMLLFQGGADYNDSVPQWSQLEDQEAFGSDSYSYDQAVWVHETLGPETVKRVGPVRLVYEAFGMEDFAYYIIPNAGHETDPMEENIRIFFACVLEGRASCARTK